MKTTFFLTLFIVTVTGCRSLDRSPSHFEVKNSNACEKTEYGKVQLSALTGYPVGPLVGKSFPDPTQPLLRPFSSDGCSSSPETPLFSVHDLGWTDCCVQHDLKYWAGGTKEDRNTADADLKVCLKKKEHHKTAFLFHFFVDKFGGPDSHRSYRWGYGWNFSRAYAPLSEQEKLQVSSYQQTEQQIQSDNISPLAFDLIRKCDYQDPIFYGITADEKRIYSFLNSRLKKKDVIEWARMGYWNNERIEYQLKLQSCTEPMTFVLDKTAETEPQVSDPCF